MGSAMLNKSPSSFLVFVYGFLLISFFLNIPHAQGAVRAYSGRSRSLGVNDGASRVGAPPAKPDSNAQRRPPNKGGHDSLKQSSEAVVTCRGSTMNRACVSVQKNSTERSSSNAESPMYNWVEGVPPSYNSGGGLYPGRH